MKVKITSIKDPGTLSKERVVLKANAKLDIGEYVLCVVRLTADDEVSTKIRGPFWFPDKIVNKGDYIILYSKAGIDTEEQNRVGTITHKFYRRLLEPLWIKDTDGAVLFEIGDWQAQRPQMAK